MKNKFLTSAVSVSLALMMSVSAFAAGPASSKATEYTAVKVSETQFEEIGTMSEGFVPVKVNGLWGYADKNGNIVIDAKYAYAGEMLNGVAVVAKSSDDYEFSIIIEAYVMDKAGNETKLKMKTESGFHGYSYDYHWAQVENNKVPVWFDEEDISSQISRRGGLIVIKNSQQLAIFREDGSEVEITDPNNLVHAPFLDYDLSSIIINDSEAYFLDYEKQRMHGAYPAFYVTSVGDDGSIAFQGTYRPYYVPSVAFIAGNDGVVKEAFDYSCGESDSGYVLVWASETENGNRLASYYDAEDSMLKWVILDKNGEIVNKTGFIAKNYRYDGDTTSYVTSGLIRINDANGKYGAIDTDGNLVIPFEYDVIYFFDDYDYAFAQNDGKYIIVDRNNQRYDIDGAKMTDSDYVIFDGEYRYAVIDADGKWYILSSEPADGKFVVTATVEAENLNYIGEGYYSFSENGVYYIAVLAKASSVYAGYERQPGEPSHVALVRNRHEFFRH